MGQNDNNETIVGRKHKAAEKQHGFLSCYFPATKSVLHGCFQLG
jgi:hypothetical protein